MSDHKLIRRIINQEEYLGYLEDLDYAEGIPLLNGIVIPHPDRIDYDISGYSFPNIHVYKNGELYYALVLHCDPDSHYCWISYHQRLDNIKQYNNYVWMSRDRVVPSSFFKVVDLQPYFYKVSTTFR